jgi:outer membrane protein TolC
MLKIIRWLQLFIIVTSSPVIAQPPSKVLSERDIITLYRSESALSRSLAAQKDQGQLQKSLLQEMYSTQAFSSLSFANSDERALTPFQPTIGPASSFSAGVRKKYPRGFSGSVEAFAQEVSTSDGAIDQAAQFGGRATFNMDLWRNYLGKLDEAGLKSAAASQARIELEAEIASRNMEFELRKLFWSLLAVDESLGVTDTLIRSAERQLQEARVRARDGVADRGEVARYQAQVESRRASRINLEFQREQIESLLKRQISSLQGLTIVSGPVDLKEQEKRFQVCSEQILRQSETPLQYAAATDLLTKLREEFEQKQIQAEHHSSPDLVFQVSLQRSGVDQGTGAALDDFASRGKFGYSLGLNLLVPLDGQSDFSEQLLLSTQKNAYEAQTLQLKNELAVVHAETRRAFELLARALNRQAEETKYLKINLAESTRKFKQGRIPVSTLILEQDGLFSSELTEIDIKRRLVHAMYDYFRIFTRHPCPMNRIDEGV